MKPHRKNDARKERVTVPADSGQGPIRQCTVTKERLPQSELVRFVAGPDGTVVPDVTGKLPGRGVWVSAARETVDQAVKSKAFNRGLKKSVVATIDLADTVEALLLGRCQGLLGMARKSGSVTIGFDQVRARLRGHQPGWILAASDSAEDGRNKVHFLAEALYGEVETSGALNASELGMAFGRTDVVHAVIDKGPLAKRWATAYRRLAGFRLTPESDWFSGKDR